MAEEYHQKTFGLLDKVKDSELGHGAYYNAANYYLNIGNPEKALEYANKAAQYKIVGKGFNNMLLLQLFYKAHLALGNYKESTQFFEKYDALRDSLNIEQTTINIEKQRIEHDFKTREEINRLHDKQNRLSLTVAILVLCVVLLILSLILIRYKNNLVKEKLLNNLNKLRENELRLQIELKDKELASKVIAETRREEVYNSVLEDLKKIKLKFGKEETRQALNSVLSKLESSSNKAIWEEFELRFANVYESFYRNLQVKHPTLSHYDKRICALIKLNLSSKEIADITGVTVKAVENTRTRLRKKLTITNEKIDLNQYLSAI